MEFPHKRRWERGQTTIFFVLLAGLVTVAFAAFATDFANLWFHRQKARGAADAACQAGALDLMLYAEGQQTATMNFVPALNTTFDCMTKPTAAPCLYAKFNGYTGAGLTSTAASSSVSISFPTSIAGVPQLPAYYGVTVPYISVAITDRAPTFFSKIFTRTATVDVIATASCGLVPVAQPTPLVLLHPTTSSSLNTQGTSSISILGGPQKSIQVNSSQTSAVSLGGSTAVDLTKAGPSKTGGDLTVFGGPSSAPSQFRTGATGHWIYPATPTVDPYATIVAPTKPANAPNPARVTFTVNGCPDPSGCDEYVAGYYPSGITVKNKTAIFDPGLYYLGSDLVFDSGSTVRMSTANGDGTAGIVFYLSGGHTVSVDSNSGSTKTCATATSKNCVVSYKPDGSTFLTVKSVALQCANGAPNPTEVPATIDGNILLGPCTGPSPGQTQNYGDPAKTYRGFLFFQDRSAAAIPSWGGGGQFLLAGIMYFHQCNSSGTGIKCLAPGSGGYGTVFSMGGGSGAGAYAVGNIVTDKLTIAGNSGINMILNPSASTSILKVQLLQ